MTPLQSNLVLVLGVVLALFGTGFIAVAQTTEPVCLEKGRCAASSVFLTYEYGYDNSNDCLEFCQNYNKSSLECNWFQLNYNNTICTLFNTCSIGVETQECPDCIVGESTCSFLKCDNMGTCTGATFLGITKDVPRFNDCIDDCKGVENDRCQHVSYNEDTMTCLLFDSCPNLSQTNETADFVTAEKLCRFG